MAAAVRVDKATNELLLGPDWTLNMDICDSVNSDHGQAKEVIKALKKRIQHKNANVQFLALTLLETLVKNCGDRVHVQVIERNILEEMMKIVKKKADIKVRDKVLTLLDSWQEAFGGPGGKHPHYYWAYAELKRTGVEFPKRSPDAAPIFTPPVTRPASLPSYIQAGYGMPVDSSSRLDEAMSSNGASLSMPDLERMLGAAELLSEMLRAVDPNDQDAVNDEIITELVNQCRADQKRILSLVSSLRDEELLGQALDLNDNLQILLEKHDAMASGSPLPAEDVVSELPAGTTPNLGEKVAPTTAVAPTIVSTNVLNDDEEEDEDDEFSQLARRNSRFKSTNAESASPSLGTSSSTIQEGIPSSAVSVLSTTSSSVPSNALSLPDPPSPVRASPEEQVMSDLLALTISSNSSSPYTPLTPEPALNQGGSTASGHPHPQPYHVKQEHETAHYVAPWAQPQSQTAGIQQQTPSQSHLPYNSSAYPPPPWASQDSIESNPFMVPLSQHQSSSNSPISVPPSLRPLQQSHSFAVPLRTASLDSPINRNPKQPLSAGARKPSYVSSNNFFDDLFERNSDGSLKVGSTFGSGTSSPYKA